MRRLTFTEFDESFPRQAVKLIMSVGGREPQAAHLIVRCLTKKQKKQTLIFFPPCLPLATYKFIIYFCPFIVFSA